MTRSLMLALALVVVAAGTATAQQVVTPQPQSVRMPQPTRSYRSYSVTPSSAAANTARPTTRHPGEGSWRDATAKAGGHYTSGR